MNFTEPVIAALIGATATVVTAFVQLRVAGKKQAAERAAGKTVPARSGSRWLAILGLMLAAAVGGYAFSEYQSYHERQDNKVLREEMHTRMRELSEAALRFERAGTERNGQSESEVRAALERRRGADGVAAVFGVPPCRGAQVGFAQAPAPCAENDALRTSVCVAIPPSAVPTEVQVFSRLEDSVQPWSEVRMQPGQESSSARFADTFFERATPDGKEICQQFLHWNSQKGRLARILVKYVP
jgi:hypothetical protein